MKLLLLYDLVWSRISADIGLIMNAGPALLVGKCLMISYKLSRKPPRVRKIKLNKSVVLLQPTAGQSKVR